MAKKVKKPVKKSSSRRKVLQGMVKSRTKLRPGSVPDNYRSKAKKAKRKVAL